MKKVICYMIVLLLLLAGCSRQEPADIGMPPDEITAAILNSQSGLPALIEVHAGEEDFSIFLSDYYSISPDSIADGIIHYADGVEASEIAVLVLNDEKDAKTVQSALDEYRQSRAGVFEGYAPQQAAMAQNGKAAVNGKYVVLLICPDPAAGQAAFLSCFGKQLPVSSSEPTQTAVPESSASISEVSSVPVSEPSSQVDSTDESAEEPAITDTDGSYNPAAILQAWQSGDDSGLQERNREILRTASEVIDQEITDGITNE